MKAQQQQHQQQQQHHHHHHHHHHQQQSGMVGHHRQPAVGITAVSCRGCRPQPHPYARLQPWAVSAPTPQQAPGAPTRTRAREPAGPPEHANGGSSGTATSRKWNGATSSKRRQTSSVLGSQHHVIGASGSAAVATASLLTPSQQSQVLQSLATSLTGTHGNHLPNGGQSILANHQIGNSYSSYETSRATLQSTSNTANQKNRQQQQQQQAAQMGYESGISAAQKTHHQGTLSTTTLRCNQTSLSHSTVSQKQTQQQLNHQTTAIQNSRNLNSHANQMSHSLSQLSHSQQQQQQQQQQQHYQSMSVSNAENWLLGNYLPAPTSGVTCTEWCQGGKGCGCVSCTSRRTYSQSQSQGGSWYYPQHETTITSSSQLQRLFQNV